MRLRSTVEIVLPPIAWLGPWVAFLFVPGNTSTHIARHWIAATLLVAANLYVLFDVLLRARIRALPRGFVFAGFVLTLSALVGAYAYADLAASHANLACYAGQSGSGVTLNKGSAIYYAMSTLTTAGFGDIVAHSRAYRWLTTAELAVGLTTVGLSIAAVGARIFEDRSQPGH